MNPIPANVVQPIPQPGDDRAITAAAYPYASSAVTEMPSASACGAAHPLSRSAVRPGASTSMTGTAEPTPGGIPSGIGTLGLWLQPTTSAVAATHSAAVRPIALT